MKILLVIITMLLGFIHCEAQFVTYQSNVTQTDQQAQIPGKVVSAYQKTSKGWVRTQIKVDSFWGSPRIVAEYNKLTKTWTPSNISVRETTPALDGEAVSNRFDYVSVHPVVTYYFSVYQ